MTAESTPPANSGNEPNADVFARLHRMSRTAGVGSTDYVAVNSVSVASLIVGLLSFLATFDNVLLLVPLVGLFLGFIAIRQILRSSGTQTGLAPALIGVLASLGFAGFVGASAVAETLASKRDRQVIEEVRARIAAAHAKGDYAAAYAEYSPVFQQRMSFADFESFWKNIENLQYGGKVVSVSWNGRMEADKAPNSPSKFTRVVWSFKVERQDDPFTREVALMQVGDDWKVHDVQNLFPPPPDATKTSRPLDTGGN